MNALLSKLAPKVDQGEAYHLRAQTVPVEFRAGTLHSVQTTQTEGIALRVVRAGRLGFATTTDLEHDETLIDAALASSAFGEALDIRFPEAGAAAEAHVFDRALAALTQEDLISLGEETIAQLTSIAPKAEINVSVVKTVEAVEVGNTAGRTVAEDRTSLSIGIEVSRAKEGDIFILSDGLSVRCLEDLDADAVVRRLARHLSHSRRIVPAPTRALPVVFTPNGAIALLLPLIVGFNGRSVFTGTSPLRNRTGEQAFDERFSLTDDGTVPRGPRSGGFDDEGLPTTRTTLVENGTVRGFVYDLRTAALAGTRPTGNGYKGGVFGSGGFRTAPSTGMSNVVVRKGERLETGLISGIEEGLLVESVLGLGQGNINAGEFSNNVAVAFKIEDGKIVGRVKNTMIAGNAYSLLKEQLIGLGSEPQWAGGALQTPAIAVDGVSVVGNAA